MKLLIFTQTVDTHDPILGFFHNWIAKLAERYEFLTIICLKRGEVSLPANVKVLSLGKESGASRLQYITRFYRYIWQERKQYDAVFVHMNQEYILLGWKLWKLLGKKIYLWRNHRQGNLLTHFAVLVSDKVFYTSKDSFTARFKKAIKMPVGIDTDLCKDEKLERKSDSILFLGRIAPVKNVQLFLDALKFLKEKDIEFSANVYGDALPKDQTYFDELQYKNLAHFHAGVPNTQTPKIYNEHTLYVNLTPSGSFDKTILEAAACGCIPIITNKSLESASEFSYLLAEPNAESVANTITTWLKADEATRSQKSESLRIFVEKEHSLSLLINRLDQEIKL